MSAVEWHHYDIDVISPNAEGEKNGRPLKRDHLVNITGDMRCYGRRETKERDIDKDFSQVTETSVFRAESLPAPYAMAFIDSDQDEVCLELVVFFDGMALEVFSGIHEHLWRGIYYLEVAVVDFSPQCSGLPPPSNW